MKKRLLACFLTAAFTLALLSGCSQDSSSSAPANTDHAEEKELTKVTLNEVAHSIFYAPMYVAVEEGYFAEEGIDLDLVCGFGKFCAAHTAGGEFPGGKRRDARFHLGGSKRAPCARRAQGRNAGNGI